MMDEPYVVEPSMPVFWRIAVRAYWIVVPVGTTVFLHLNDPSRGLAKDIALAVLLTVVCGLMLGIKLPQRYEIDEEGIKIRFGWPRSHTFFFRDELQIEAGGTAGFWTLQAANDRKGLVTIRRDISSVWQWRNAVISVADRDRFIKEALRRRARYRPGNDSTNRSEGVERMR